MNKEKGIYELLPSEPVDVAAMLIKATIVTDAPVFAPLSPMLEGKLVAIPKYDPVQLQQIAEHLLVYCNAQERAASMSLTTANKNTSSQSITDAISVLRHELLQHGEIYQGFKSSLKSALEIYSTCRLPFEPEEETAEKILDFMIGGER